MRESEIERKLRIEIKKINGMCLKFVPMHHVGFPDRICLLPKGICVFVELKSPNKKPKKIQIWVHNSLRKMGFDVLIIDSLEKIKRFIEKYKNA